MEIDPGLVARLRRQLATGEVVLFTGAGFSLGAVARDGRPIASAGELKAELWRLAFQDRPQDEESSLADVYELAVSRAGNAVRDLLNRRLMVDSKSLPGRYLRWFELPWYRHYTLNVDDLDEAVATRSPLPRDLRSISAVRGDGLTATGDLLSVHLNGRIRDFPDVTFSAAQYGQRLARADPWYQAVVADLLNHPIVFVGTVLEEPGLWQHIEIRQQRSRSAVELRPPSYLVSPWLPAARAALLKRYNIDWVEADEEEFFSEALEAAYAESEQGHKVLAMRYHPSRGRATVRSLAEIRQEDGPEDLAQFLLGREPSWRDVTEGFAVGRTFEAELLEDALAGRHQVYVITGTAASGKSTSAMRLALGLESADQRVVVIEANESDRRIPRVLAAVERLRPDVVLVDDIDLFGERAAALVDGLVRLASAPRVVTALRSSRLQALELTQALDDVPVREQTVPVLHDRDINGLIAALERANRLGRLAGLSPAERRRIFREQCGRQLLVAMYQATSGESLHARVFSECEDLHGSARVVYGMAALATAERMTVTKDELTIGLSVATGGIDNQKLGVVEDLAKRQLLIHDGGGLRLRHRWIAETAIEFFQANGILGVPLKGLTLALATKADPQAGFRTREQRLLRRLLNHAHMQRLTADLEVVREVYALVEDYLAWSYHYWLQRGSFEVEVGDLALAENFLGAALSKAPNDDFHVSTEYAYLMLKKASQTPSAPQAEQWAESALQDLEHTIAVRGASDSYPFHVYGSQGLSWARRAPMSRDRKVSLVRRLLDTVERGTDLHPKRTDLRRLAKDLKREYLGLAMPGTPLP